MLPPFELVSVAVPPSVMLLRSVELPLPALVNVAEISECGNVCLELITTATDSRRAF